MYEKKPKYLCLIIHAPLKEDEINKLSDDASKKGLKKVRRVELWFSIPEDKVNNLYDFFIHWTPDKYGESESDIDPELCGFVVVDEDGRCDNETDDIEFIDDHYSKSVGKKSLSRSYSTTWEIVRKDEARRRILEAEEENLPPPELNEKSSILTDSDVATLNSVLLPRAIGYSWSLTYSTNNHGISLKTLYRSMRNLDCPVLLCVKDSNNQVFGAMLPSPIVMSDHFYGTGESFLWTFYNGFKRYKWTGHNNFFIKGNTESLAIGAGFGSFGLWLDGDLNHGRTQKCQTYNNELLTEREDFMIRSVEVWSFV